MERPTTEAASVDLRDYMAVLSRQRWLILIAAALGLGAALGYSLASTPMYSATAEVLVRPLSLDPLDTGTDELSMDRRGGEQRLDLVQRYRLRQSPGQRRRSDRTRRIRRVGRLGGTVAVTARTRPGTRASATSTSFVSAVAP
jgi:uncharacterized protein involved in exopolysaccharide biosynthesis